MFDNLQSLVREHAGEAIINNPAIPNDKNEEVVADASNSIFTGLKSAIANGNTDAVTSLFNSGSQGALSSPVTRNIQDGFVNNLMQKFGLDHGKASGIATSLIPIVLQKLVHKTNDPNDKSFDLGGILGNLTGGSSGGGMLGKITGMFN